MTITCLRCSVYSLALFAAPLAWGQEAGWGTNSVRSFDLETNAAPKLNRLALSYRMGLNIRVDFKKLGGFAPIGDPGPATGTAVDRTYDNGSYNKVDSSGNLGGQTWNWGYQRGSQVQGGSVVMESSSSPNDAKSKHQYDDPQHGLEMIYSRELFRDAEDWKVGVEAAFGYTHVSVSDSRRVFSRVDRIIDTFSIPPGVVVPLPPYNGTFEGPGALIGSGPDRATTVLSREAIITGERNLESDVLTLRLGPYLEVPIYKRLSMIFDGGLFLAVGLTDFSYHETVTISDVGSTSRSSSGSQDDFLVGGYIGGSLSYAVTDRIGVFCGAHFQAAGRSVADSRTRGGDVLTKKQSVLDFGEAFVVSVGASYSF
jgi:hypothetical protein